MHLCMRTTIDIPDALLNRAKRHMHESHQTFRALVISALERELAKKSSRRFQLRDASVGLKGGEKISNDTINQLIDQQRESVIRL